MNILASPEWPDVAEEISSDKGLSLILGNVDSGKSTFTRYLARQLTSNGGVVGIVDADIGQSSLCIPGTVSAATFKTSPTDMAYRCSRFCFIGTANPALAVNAVLDAVGTLTREMRNEAETVVVDTGGLVKGNIGRGLKLAKIRLLRPDRIIAIQKEDECEEILRALDGIQVVRLAPSPFVSTRNRDVRARYRQMKMMSFLEAEPMSEHLVGEAVEFLRFGRTVNPHHLELPAGTIIGLNRGAHTLDIGVVVEAGRHPLIQCHLPTLKGVNRIVFGDLSLEAPSGGD